MIKASLTGNFRKEFDREISQRKVPVITRLVGALAAATPVKTGNAQRGWRYNNLQIVNDVDYISNLNAGASKQAPAHFVEAALLRQGAYPNGTIVRNTR